MRRSLAVLSLLLTMSLAPALAGEFAAALVGFDTTALRSGWRQPWTAKYLDQAASQALLDQLRSRGVARLVRPAEVRTKLQPPDATALKQPSPENAKTLGALLGVDWVMYGEVVSFATESKEGESAKTGSTFTGSATTERPFEGHTESNRPDAPPAFQGSAVQYKATVRLRLKVYDAATGALVNEVTKESSVGVAYSGSAAGDRTVPTRALPLPGSDEGASGMLTPQQAQRLQRGWDDDGGQAMVLPAVVLIAKELESALATAEVIAK